MSADAKAALQLAHSRISAIFQYERDEILQQHLSKPDGWANMLEHWASWEEISRALRADRLVDDCDGWALAVRGMMWHYWAYPSVLVFCQVPGGGHLICSTLDGWCSDNRFPMGIVSRDDLERVHEYRFVSRSALQTDKDQSWRTVE